MVSTCVHSPWILSDALEGECPHCANRGTVACKAESLPRDHKTEVEATMNRAVTLRDPCRFFNEAWEVHGRSATVTHSSAPGRHY